MQTTLSLGPSLGARKVNYALLLNETISQIPKARRMHARVMAQIDMSCSARVMLELFTSLALIW